MRRALPIWPILLLAVVVWPARACNIPVFRYALERWEAEPYRAVVFSHGLLSADTQTLKSLKNSPANLSVTVVDVDNPASPDALKLWQAHGTPVLPWLAVSLPQDETLVWSGALDAAGLANLLDSPARKQLRQQLLDGATVVWVLLESGDASRDDKTAAFLEKQSADLAKRLQLPGADSKNPPSPSEGLNESILLSGLPLKLAFSVVRVSRTAPEEKFFTALLLQSEFNPDPDTPEHVEPLVFPVFGRGRALPALKVKDLLPEIPAQKNCCPHAAIDVLPATLSDAALFLTSMCSCDVKELNPGTDLLISANWETELMTGKYQRTFFGIFAGLSETAEKLDSNVAGSFVTDASDKKPGRTYLVKLENGNKAVLETLKRYDGKIAQVRGKLLDFGPDGEAKYLIVSSVVEDLATPRAKERRPPGGL